MSKFGGGAKCPCCGKTVYFAEEVLAAGNKYHKLCFKCTECNKPLDSSTMAENEGKLFCQPCHRRNFGLKGYGYGGGAGVLASEAGSHTDSGAPSGAATGPTGYSSYGVTKGSGVKSGGGGGGGGKYGSSDHCPRCGNAVYMAEKIIGAGSAWHKGCFSCSICNKKLDSTTVADRDGEIYCKNCYGKEFGPKGVGFGQGSGTLTTT